MIQSTVPVSSVVLVLTVVVLVAAAAAAAAAPAALVAATVLVRVTVAPTTQRSCNLSCSSFVAACCSTLQHVAACCSMLQHHAWRDDGALTQSRSACYVTGAARDSELPGQPEARRHLLTGPAACRSTEGPSRLHGPRHGSRGWIWVKAPCFQCACQSSGPLRFLGRILSPQRPFPRLLLHSRF